MYKLLSSKTYLDLIVKYRIFIFIFTFTLFALSATHINMNLLAKTEQQFWTQGIIQSDPDSHKYISKITLEFNHIDQQAIAKAKRFENYLHTIPGVHTDSIFNQNLWYKNDSGGGSESLGVVDSSQIDLIAMNTFLHKFKEQIDPYVDNNHFYIFVSSDTTLNIDTLQNTDHIKLSIDNMNDKQISVSNTGIVLYSFFSLLFIFVLFTVFFKHIAAGLSSLFVIISTSIFSIFIIQALMPHYLLHITNILILMSISILDYLYFYYRWHHTQYNKTSVEALEQSLNRNIVPAFMTTFITIVSLISLYFTGSDIIKAITLSIMVPSVIAYILNVTFLPAFLSYFTITNTNILLGKAYERLTQKMFSYNKKVIHFLMGASILFIGFMGIEYVTKKDYLFSNNDNSVLKYSIPYDQQNNNSILEAFAVEEELKSKFKDIEKISSLAQDLNAITQLNNNASLSEENIDEAIFFLQLYNKDQVLQNDIVTSVIIKESSLMKPNIIFYIQGKNISGVQFLDMDSQISNSKFFQIKYMIYSLFVALISLSVIISVFFKKRIMILGSLFVNILPLLGFAALLHIYKVTITIEVFVAMAIALAISSDSTVHFMYAYLRNRFYAQNQERSLHGMILFSGTPLLISTLTLLTTFSLLILTGIPELVKIGLYTSFLLFVGLIVNMMILPVIILSSDHEINPKHPDTKEY